MTSPWSAAFHPPSPPATDRLRLEVLGPPVVELDYEAIMGSRRRLRDELQWGRERRWPPDDFTLEDNRADLQEHRREYDAREAYAYTVLDPAGARCLGCIYLGPSGPDAQLTFWVIDEEVRTGLETHLLETVLHWIRAAWPLDRVLLPVRPANDRGQSVLRALGLETTESGGPGDHVCFEWARPVS